MMIGKAYIISSGYDPERGKLVNDPHLGPSPTLGPCRPDIREQLKVGDHIFSISGKVDGAKQLIMGGFEIAEKIHANEAYERFPDLRMHTRDDGQVDGNIIVNAQGRQHTLDDHDQFERRSQNYIVGKNPIVLATPYEIAEGREHTLEILEKIFGKKGDKPLSIIGRCSNMSEKQVIQLRECLRALKAAAHEKEVEALLPKINKVSHHLMKAGKS